MKWFQHLSEFHTSPKGRKILRKYGVEGVGIWWITCELVAKDGIKYRIKKGKDWFETLLDVTKVEKKLLEDFLKFLSEINSIDKKALNVGELYVPKMKEYASNWIKRTENLQRYDRVPTAIDKITLDKIRKEEPKISSSKNSKPFYKSTGEEMRFSKNKWWVIPKIGGEWLEFAGSIKNDIVYKNI